MAVSRILRFNHVDLGSALPSGSAFTARSTDLQPTLDIQRYSTTLFQHERQAADEVLIKKSKETCERFKLQFAKLSAIQRKFITHYRCSQCGLQPLYHLDPSHIKRVRCRQCGQLIAFTNRGKYGKIRKEIALSIAKEVGGFGQYPSQ